MSEESHLDRKNLYRYWNIKERFKVLFACHPSYVPIRYDRLSSLHYGEMTIVFDGSGDFGIIDTLAVRIEGIAGRKGSGPKFDIISRVISR